jgi:hypothetical protein
MNYDAWILRNADWYQEQFCRGPEEISLNGDLNCDYCDLDDCEWRIED